MSKKNIYLVSLGCPRNLVDSEVLLGMLEKYGFFLTDNPQKASILIVNTCGFTEDAKKESIDIILQLCELKKASNGKFEKKLIVAGCLSQRYPRELMSNIKEVDAVFGSSDFVKIPHYLSEGNYSKINVSKSPDYLYSHRDKRSFITPKHYAYVKIQEGCKNKCSYCVIPQLRGRFRSRKQDSILTEIENLSKNKYLSEINLIGQDTTLYGDDVYKKPSLGELVDKISDIAKERWIRVLYTHPAHYTDKFIDVVAEKDNICKYFDIPIQHINDTILKKMNRKTCRSQIELLIKKIRKRIPEAAIRTSIITGFPGETKEQFDELLVFLKDIGFERLGAFMYSDEEGTVSSKMKGKIPEKTKKVRFEKIFKLQQEISLENNKKLLSKNMKVLIDEKCSNEKDLYLGRTYMDAPDVDGICYIRSKENVTPGKFIMAKITGFMEYDLVGEPV